MDAIFFSSISSKQQIDSASGVISGVSVITEGQADTHNLWIDGVTISQIRDAAIKFSSGVKVRMNHPKKGEDAAVQSTAGTLKNFRVDGNQLRADLHLLKSDPHFSKIIEMAEKMPEDFGLSISVPPTMEKIGEKIFLRTNDIYAVDLVDAPAANPSGLFSKQPNTVMIQLDKTELCKTLGLDPAKATEAEIQTAYLSRLKAPEAVDLTAVNAKIAELSQKLPTVDLAALQSSVTALQSAQVNALNLAKKSEIDALTAEASRDGKVIPIEAADLYEVKDGTVTIKTEPSYLRKMLSKLSKSVSLNRREIKPPANKDGKVLTGDERVQFCAEKREEGAAQLNAKFHQMFPELNRN